MNFNFTKTIRDNHAKYLNSWIKCLNNDYTFLTGATAQAQKAVIILCQANNSQRDKMSQHFVNVTKCRGPRSALSM